MLEARVVQDQLAAPLSRGPDFHRGAEALGQFLFEAREVPIASFPAARRRRTQQALDQRLCLAHRQALRTDARAELDLARGIERSEERRVGKECRSWRSPYH